MAEGLQERGIKPIANVLSELCKFKCLCLEGRNSILRVSLPISSHIQLTEEKHEIVCVHLRMERSPEWSCRGKLRISIRSLCYSEQFKGNAWCG